MNSDGLDLSLAGSQMNVVSSSHRPGSARRANLKPNPVTKSVSSVNGSVGSSKTKGKNSTRSNRTLTQRSDMSSHCSDTSSYRGDTPSYRGDTPGAGDNRKQSFGSKKLTAKDDFLALFESSNVPAKTSDKSQQRPPGSRPAWMTPAGSSQNSSLSASMSKTPSTQPTKTSHSVFTPTRGRNSGPAIDKHLAARQNVNITANSHHHNTDMMSSLSSRTREDIALNLCLDDDVFASRISDAAVCRSRNNSHSDCNGGSTSNSERNGKLNSIVNNMTSLAMSPGGTKASFLGLENCYQNLKPNNVNQVTVKRVVSRDERVYHNAAVRIQRWYRRCSQGPTAQQGNLKRMLAAKKRDLEEQRDRERVQAKERESNVKDRTAIREEKARLARQKAIEELHRKREEKRRENERMAGEEMAMVKETGKVGRPRKGNVVRKKTRAKVTREGSSSEGETKQRVVAAGGSRACNIDDLFQQDTRPKTTMEPATAWPHTPDGATSSRDGAAEVTPSEAATNKTTLEDLMETLKKLEEEDVSTTSRKGKNQKPLDWLDELEKPRPQESQSPTASKDNLKKSSFLTDEKLRSIMTYLDEVETAERLTGIDQELDKANKALELPALLVPSGEELAQLEHATATASEVTQSMLRQKMDLEEKKRTVAMLQKALSQQRELTVRHAKETERDMKQRLQLQKREHEGAMTRHLSFIDQLIDDKKNLSEKCEKLVIEMKTIYKKYEDQMKTTKDGHELKLRKERELAAATEKLRREKWIEEKTKKIKEMTVRGLEPEIQRLIAKHKAEIKKLKSIEQAEVLVSDERAAQRYVKMTEELRDQLASEKEAACGRERELARQTYEKQMQQEEEAYQAQRRRLYAEVAEEKERLAQQAMRQRTEIDRLQRQLEDSHSNAGAAMKTEYETAREEQQRRHQGEICQLKEQLALEKKVWEENYMKRKETWLMTKERELKEQVRRDRDREIELVIQRLEEDNQSAKEESDRVADNRIKRNRDKFEKEIEELERSERLTREKYNTTKAKLTELEGETGRLNVVLKERDKETIELKKLLDRLNEERSRMAEVIRQDFANRLVATEEENKQLKMEMSEQKARHQVQLNQAKADIEAVERAKDEEMEEVHRRVKQAILKKEDVVKQIQEQHQAAVKRADHLEGLLEQQRKQLLRK